MTTTEKLQRIKEICTANLELAACAGAAEAGWKATIAAIDYIGCDAEIFDANTPRGDAARSQLAAIISAWKDQL